MRGLLRSARRKVALTAVGAALLAAGVGFGAHYAAGSSGTRPVSDVTTVTSPAATSSAASSPTAAPTPTATASSGAAATTTATADSAPQQQVGATVQSVTEPTTDPTPTTTDPAPTTDPTTDPAPQTVGGWIAPEYRTMPKLPGEDSPVPPDQPAPSSNG